MKQEDYIKLYNERQDDRMLECMKNLKGRILEEFPFAVFNNSKDEIFCNIAGCDFHQAIKLDGFSGMNPTSPYVALYPVEDPRYDYFVMVGISDKLDMGRFFSGREGMKVSHKIFMDREDKTPASKPIKPMRINQQKLSWWKQFFKL